MTEKVYFTVKETDVKDFKTYLYERENAETTISKYSTDLRCFLKFLGNSREVDKARLLAYKEWLIERYAVSSVNSMLAALNQFLEFCGYAQLKVKRVKTQKNLFLREEKELTRKEYQRLVRTAKAEGKVQLALCMEVIAVTGVRVSELKYFTVEQVKKGRIEVHNKGKYRRIFLTSDIRKKLLCFAMFRKITRGYIFATKSGKAKDRSNFSAQSATSVCKGILSDNQRYGRAGGRSGTQQPECNTDLHIEHRGNLPAAAGKDDGSADLTANRGNKKTT